MSSRLVFASTGPLKAPTCTFSPTCDSNVAGKNGVADVNMARVLAM